MLVTCYKPVSNLFDFQVDESGLISVDSVEAIFETIVANKTEPGWMDSVSNFFGGNVCCIDCVAA